MFSHCLNLEHLNFVYSQQIWRLTEKYFDFIDLRTFVAELDLKNICTFLLLGCMSCKRKSFLVKLNQLGVTLPTLESCMSILVFYILCLHLWEKFPV